LGRTTVVGKFILNLCSGNVFTNEFLTSVVAISFTKHYIVLTEFK
jgi:hypothetical protein